MRGTHHLTLPALAPRPSDVQLYGILFAGAVMAFCLGKVLGDGFGAPSTILATLGDATCGWSWLLVRALFRRPDLRREIGPLALVITMVAIGAVVRLGGANLSPLLRLADNAEGLVSSALLLLATIEPLKGIRAALPVSEKRFRIGFAVSYATILTIAVLMIDGAPTDSAAAHFSGVIKGACALAALAGMGFAIWYRSGNPVPEARRPRQATAAGSDHALGQRILARMRADYVRPELRVTDLARGVGEADYKVTQCITGILGFRNFNHMANHFRIAEARVRLADPRWDHLPILTIALDCGFGSIGPFNRAFKTETGATPMQFRKTRSASPATLRDTMS
ncbi:helix-turn-helix domain-containing protein [Sphingomonas sp.]|uniref:helix-turn-helix domain-containing protein n=1 Tax=Sphingomonas sp. TaxID=28214 RepID=UPI003B3B4771